MSHSVLHTDPTLQNQPGQCEEIRTHRLTQLPRIVDSTSRVKVGVEKLSSRAALQSMFDSFGLEASAALTVPVRNSTEMATRESGEGFSRRALRRSPNKPSLRLDVRTARASARVTRRPLIDSIALSLKADILSNQLEGTRRAIQYIQQA